MSNSSSRDLLGYLVGALETDERLAVEQALEQDASLQDELRGIRRRLEILSAADFDGGNLEQSDWDFAPPPGLADRTLEFIACQTCAEPSCGSEYGGSEFDDAQRPSPVEPIKKSWRGAAREPLVSTASRWRLVDVAVAVAVCVAAGALVFPVLSASRSNARITACANNLREIGMALTQYSENQNGFFPRVAETGSLAVGGIYAPTLLSEGYITNPRVFVCPASSVADNPALEIPRLAELTAATGKKLDALRREMGGSYGYALGYRQGGVYRPTRNLHRESFALAADMPSEDCTCSPNHRGLGHNVLLEDGHIVFLNSCRLEGSTDDIFTNDEGKVAAGCHINDAVIVRSDVSP